MRHGLRVSTALCAVFTSTIILSIASSGCGGLVGNPHPPKDDKSDKKSYIAIDLTDAPIDDANQVFVSFSSFALSMVEEGDDEGDWHEFQLSVSENVELLSLQGGKTIPFGFHPGLPAGDYKRMRVKFSDTPPKAVLHNGTEVTLTWADTAEDGVVLPITLSSTGDDLHYVLDFDVRRSLRLTEENQAIALTGVEFSLADYAMDPALRLVNADLAGEITGTVEDFVGASLVCIYEVGADKDDATQCDNSVNSAPVVDGKFVVPFLPPGDYEIRAFKDDGDFTDEGAATVAAPEPKIELTRPKSKKSQYGLSKDDTSQRTKKGKKWQKWHDKRLDDDESVKAKWKKSKKKADHGAFDGPADGGKQSSEDRHHSKGKQRGKSGGKHKNQKDEPFD